ncbi:MAG: porin family protein [Chlorobi bacterium]|nr:porin family protein [Chlorobiota bacterium]
MKTLKIFSIILLVAIGVEMSAQNKTSIYYTMGIPMSNTSDYIDKTSFRGMGFEYQYLLTDNFAVGGVLQWSTFYQDLPKDTYPLADGSGAITGYQYRYINTVPMYLTGTYYLASDDATVRPYLGLGIGTYWMEQRTDMGLYSDINDTWQFSLVPKAGLLIPVSYSTSLYLGLDYNIGFKNSDLDQQSWLGISVGFNFDY